MDLIEQWCAVHRIPAMVSFGTKLSADELAALLVAGKRTRCALRSLVTARDERPVV